MGTTLPKQFMMLGNSPILVRTINRIREALPVAEVVVVLPEQHIALWQNLSARFEIAPHKVVAGGKERFHSVKAGIEALSDEVKYIAIHDGVRPLLSKKMIIRLVLEAEKHPAVIPAIAPTESCRMTENDSSQIIDRERVRLIQTPQLFQAEIIRTAYEQPYSSSFTDDASVVEAAGHNIYLCEGERTNIKITTPDDILFAEAIIQAHDEELQI